MADGDGGRNGSGLGMLARAVADAVPGIVEQLTAANRPHLHREALALLERPLLAHVLALTGGNQLRAARVLGLNRNTLRKRCRELALDLPRSPAAVAS
jgi:DNA-binding protein Fis